MHATEPAGALVLGHGAGGGVAAPDLVAAAGVALRSASASRSSSSPTASPAGARRAARHLDAAWIAVAEHLRAGDLRGLPLVAGGRSSGARVACRTAAETGAAGVLCLAFPLRPPQRKSGTQAPSRRPSSTPSCPGLVVQGEGDPFGMPAARATAARSAAARQPQPAQRHAGPQGPVEDVAALGSSRPVA